MCLVALVLLVSMVSVAIPVRCFGDSSAYSASSVRGVLAYFVTLTPSTNRKCVHVVSSSVSFSFSHTSLSLSLLTSTLLTINPVIYVLTSLSAANMWYQRWLEREGQPITTATMLAME